MQVKIAENKIIKGKLILAVKPGSVVKCVENLSNSDSRDKNKYLLRTNSRVNPFVRLDNGWIWGNALEDYIFAVCAGPDEEFTNELV